MSDDVQKELEQLRAENEKLKAKAESKIFLKVSEKGGVSLYGLQRFPITLYQEQWLEVFKREGEVRDFITANLPRLKSKE